MTLPPVPRPDARLLLVEDTPSLQMLYRAVLRKAGFAPICAASGTEALELFALHEPQIVLLDRMLPDCDGFHVMTEMLRRDPGARIIVISADAAIANAVEATRRGAHDYLVKPLGDTRLVSAVAGAMAQAARERQTLACLPAPLLASSDGVFQGTSPAILRLRAQVEAMAASGANVVIHGDSGTGRHACAERLHATSSRADKRLVTVDCTRAGESELMHALFGTQSPDGPPGGAFETARGSSLALHEPQDMPHGVQLALLKRLRQDELAHQAVGRNGPTNVRIISITRLDPRSDVRATGLDPDLFYRLAVLAIEMPGLDQRREDIATLVENCIATLARQEGKRFARIAPDAVADLSARDWPGHLRQLGNLLRQAVVMHDGEVLQAAMLPATATDAHAPSAAPGTADDTIDALAGVTLAEAERRLIEAAIARHDGSVPQAARELDIAPSTIYRKRMVWGGADSQGG